MKLKWVIKSKFFMGDYIALNFLEPRESKRFGIKQNEIFVREDWWRNKAKHYRLLVHEKTEIALRVEFHLPYGIAHHLATLEEHDAIRRKGWYLDKAEIKHSH